jgi:UDP-galactopyranose mutase
MVIGAGFAGCVLAERLAASLGKRVLLVDKRPHIGGNAYDYHDENGILIHKYGPHIFHTNCREVFNYLSRFTEWHPYQHRVRAWVDGCLIPINLDTINTLYGTTFNAFQLAEFYKSVAEPRAELKTSEDVILSQVGRELYEKFFRNYTRKQWGLDPSELDAAVTARVPTRTNRDDRYFTDAYQAMPLKGFTRMFDRMLDHPNIKVLLNTDYRFGKLPYRSLQFQWETLNTERAQPVAVVNYPNDNLYTRVTEFKHLTGQQHPKTTRVYEYPQAEGDPYYPIPRPENAALYKQYQELGAATPGVHFVGRLGTYKYYNMDQVVAQALTLSARIAGLTRAESLAS